MSLKSSHPGWPMEQLADADLVSFWLGVQVAIDESWEEGTAWYESSRPLINKLRLAREAHRFASDFDPEEPQPAILED